NGFGHSADGGGDQERPNFPAVYPQVPKKNRDSDIQTARPTSAIRGTMNSQRNPSRRATSRHVGFHQGSEPSGSVGISEGVTSKRFCRIGGGNDCCSIIHVNVGPAVPDIRVRHSRTYERRAASTRSRPP